jgi:phosphohistidine swiveling domain-containing protein
MTVGRKAFSLWWLASRGAAVPAAVAIPASVAAGVVAGEAVARETLTAALKRWLEPERRYAVRSSANLEDGEEESFAGQLTRLDVAAADVVAAVREVVADAQGRLADSLEHPGVSRGPAVAVVVQAMVKASAAGVSFSRNPLTGLAEVVIEAVPGSGLALADDGVTPDRWVRHWGAFTIRPDAPRVAEGIIEQVVAGVVGFEHDMGRPVAVEWAHDGRRLWWLQARPITGIEGLRVYSNRIAREVLPGVIKPLVWTVNVPIVNAAWIELLEELVGPLDVQPHDLARAFGHRAYFNMTTLGDIFEAIGMPRDSLELLLGLPKGPEAPTFRPGPGVVQHLHRLPRFVRRSLQRGRWARAEVVALRAAYQDVVRIPPSELEEAHLLGRIDDLTRLTQRAAYANIVVPLLMLAYGRGLERQVAQAGLDPAAIDPAAGRADRDAWDPQPELDRLHALLAALPREARAALDAAPSEALEPRGDLAAFDAELGVFLDRFGHLSDSGNDFSVAPWREDRVRVVRMIAARVDAAGKSGSAVCLEQVEARTSAWRRPYLRLLWRRTGAFRVYREAISSTYTWGYGLFRETFLECGARLVRRDLLEAPEDVFYLELEELRAWVSGDVPTPASARQLIVQRRRSVEAAREIIVPDIVYGDAFVPRTREDVVRDRLTGNPTSRGSARGPARIVRGAGDFERVSSGDVIVIPYSDVAWTPLFARAAAVVAEAGGMLSHSSIVAREYGIPCVVSVEHACSAIPDGASLVVDGTSGTVLVEAAGGASGAAPRQRAADEQP